MLKKFFLLLLFSMNVAQASDSPIKKVDYWRNKHQLKRVLDELPDIEGKRKICHQLIQILKISDDEQESFWQGKKEEIKNSVKGELMLLGIMENDQIKDTVAESFKQHSDAAEFAPLHAWFATLDNTSLGNAEKSQETSEK